MSPCFRLVPAKQCCIGHLEKKNTFKKEYNNFGPLIIHAQWLLIELDIKIQPRGAGGQGLISGLSASSTSSPTPLAIPLSLLSLASDVQLILFLEQKCVLTSGLCLEGPGHHCSFCGFSLHSVTYAPREHKSGISYYHTTYKST